MLFCVVELVGGLIVEEMCIVGLLWDEGVYDVIFIVMFGIRLVVGGLLSYMVEFGDCVCVFFDD